MAKATSAGFEVVGSIHGVQRNLNVSSPNLACVMMATEDVENLGNGIFYERRV